MEIKDTILGPKENYILRYLKMWPDEFVSEMQIAWQAAGESLFLKEPNWARTVLSRLLQMRLVETDDTGRYRVTDHRTATGGGRKFIAPHLREILEKNGRNMSAFSS